MIQSRDSDRPARTRTAPLTADLAVVPLVPRREDDSTSTAVSGTSDSAKSDALTSATSHDSERELEPSVSERRVAQLRQEQADLIRKLPTPEQCRAEVDAWQETNHFDSDSEEELTLEQFREQCDRASNVVRNKIRASRQQYDVWHKSLTNAERAVIAVISEADAKACSLAAEADGW
ncbi:hypothetical protein FB45DRAFT_476564 [Roridomyces roridus]|uniref:Uncharacterized protein n=1 Tax=Roridomyces roridus TaxID=1738132 RepID=A0AAD7FRC5_9AGAR|nr:hypothetical protein FB45DRAFT_476564 [Roridomyces roridus]